MEDRIIDIVVNRDELSWQNMILDLVKHEHMDPWNINISLLTQKYLDMLKKLKELDFRISGKMVLAAAILLRMKTKKLIGEDLSELDRLMRTEPEVDASAEFYEDLEKEAHVVQPGEIPELSPRTPQPRLRKVSIYDLMSALSQALEVRDRRVIRRRPMVNIKMPEKKVDIMKLTNGVYDKIKTIGATGAKITFAELIANVDRFYVFMALLYLANIDQRKIDLIQTEHYGEITIILREQTPVQVVPIVV